MSTVKVVLIILGVGLLITAGSFMLYVNVTLKGEVIKLENRFKAQNQVVEEYYGKMFAILQQKMSTMPSLSRWTRRYNFNREKIRTGSIYEIAEVFKNLTLLEKTKDLSLSEKRMLESSRELIVTEIAYSKKIRTTQAETLIDLLCCRS